MIKVTTPPLWQWSTGRKVKVTPVDGCTVDEVHFYNRTIDVALVGNMVRDADGVIADIPGVLLQTPVNLIVYSVMIDSTGKHTTEAAVFRVLERPKPANYATPDGEVDVQTTAILGDAVLGNLILGNGG